MILGLRARIGWTLLHRSTHSLRCRRLAPALWAAAATCLLVSCKSNDLHRGKGDAGKLEDAAAPDRLAPPSLDADTGGSPRTSDGASLVDASDDPAPPAPNAIRAMLGSMALSTVPPAPADVTNRWADDPAAARFGQTLFFDPSFSGKLLDGDNDGSEHALGVSGDTGKVACAGCHQPAAVYADARSLGGQISLGAGWVIRHTPSLLDVSRSRLITWIARRDALYNQPFGPVESPVEMNSSRLYVAEQMFA